MVNFPAEPPKQPPRLEGTVHEVKPLSVERLVRVVEEVTGVVPSGERLEDAIIVRWNDVSFRFCLSPEAKWLGVTSTWDPPETFVGIHCRSLGAALQEAANEWNRLYLQPTAYPMNFGASWKIVFHYSYFLGIGVTDAQVRAATRRCGDVNFQARDTIASLLPPIY